MTIRYIADGSSILDSSANVLVVPVNCCAGILGAGLALAFAKRWPMLKEAHARAVHHGFLSPGHGHMVWVTGDPDRPDPFGIYLLPTKDHWRDQSRLEWVADGLDRLALDLDGVSGPEWGERGVSSCAVPKIGCGLGGLDWKSVHPLIVKICNDRPGVRWYVY